MTKKLKIDQLFIYGLPGLPLAMLGLPLFVYLPSHYSQNLGLSLSAVGFSLLLARSFDVITDPLIGLLNDRYPKLKSPMWRRKSFMIMGVPLLLLGLNFLLRPSEGVTAFYLFFWSFITYLGWTLINIPWLALGAEISQDYHDKSALASSREIFSVIGTVAVISLPVLLSIQFDLSSTLETLANILTILLPITLIPFFWKLSSNSAEIEKSVKSTNSYQPLSSKVKLLRKKIFEVIKHPAIIRLLPAYFVNSIANALPATLFILFVSYVIKTPDQVGILLISYFLSAIAGIPLWLFLARKTDKHISWCIALSGSILSFIFVPFIGEGGFIPFLVVCLASGFCLGADVVMPASIQADISQIMSRNPRENKNLTLFDKNPTSENEQNSTALLFGIWGLLTKLSLALAVGISFPLLDFLGLNADALDIQTSSETATFTLIVLYALIPIILKVWVLIQMWSFPFGKSYFSSEPYRVSTNVAGTNINKGENNEYTEEASITRSISLSSTYKRVQ